MVFLSTALFTSDCPYKYVKTVQLKTSYTYASTLWCRRKWDSLKAGGEWPGFSTKGKTPTPELTPCPGEQTTLCKSNETHQAHNSGFQNPAMCQALCNYERHRNSGTAGLHKATHISRVRLNGNSSQIVSISVFILFPLHHSNFQEMLNI